MPSKEFIKVNTLCAFEYKRSDNFTHGKSTQWKWQISQKIKDMCSKGLPFRHTSLGILVLNKSLNIDSKEKKAKKNEILSF